MQKELAQRLLAATLKWSPEDIERYSNLIDNFAELKYDEYQQYRPGSRFVEHLCAWLNQFEEGEEREIILQFLLRNLTFISTSEMHRLIETVYPEIVLPIFESQTEGILRDYPSKEPLKDLIIELIKAKSAFFALSDGARIDVFRRVARLDHDQVCVDYSISQIKSTEMLSKMNNRANKKDPEKKVLGLFQDRFEHIFLLDDFSASGVSYLRKEGKRWAGKVFKAISDLENKKILDASSKAKIHIVLYLATDKAVNRLRDYIKDYCVERCVDRNYEFDIHFIQKVSPVQLSPQEDAIFRKKKKKNKEIITDSHYKKGDMTNPHLGFDGCGLALVIYHNTPNNSFPVIWAGENALFPRVTRHKDVR